MRPDDDLPVDAALFEVDGDTVTATEYARGPWDPRACHGGPAAAIMVRSVEQVEQSAPDEIRWQLARTTVELVRPVPVRVPMTVTSEVERPGRSVSLIATVLRTGEGQEVARARSLRIRAAAVALDPAHGIQPPFSAAGTGERVPPRFSGEETAYHRDAVELLFVEGSFADAGPAAMWCRLRLPVVAGESPSGAQRAVAAADFGNGISGELDPDVITFLNPELTVHLARRPEGEWIGVRSRSHYGSLGAGVADSELYDQVGRVGQGTQSLLLMPRR